MADTAALAPTGLDGDIALRLPVRGRAVTVAGSDRRALTVVGALVSAGAAVTVVAPRPAAYLCDLADRGLITLRQRDFEAAVRVLKALS